MLTETKLDANVHPTLYSVDDFQAPFTRHRNRHGGGIAVYAHNTISARRVHELEMDEEECIWIKIKIKAITAMACCIYLPPNLSSERTQDFLLKMTESVMAAEAYQPSTILILGDLNVGDIYLSPKMRHAHSGVTAFDDRLKHTLDSLNLAQLIDEPTRLSDSVANARPHNNK